MYAVGIIYGTCTMIGGMINLLKKIEHGKNVYSCNWWPSKIFIPHCKHQIKIDNYLIYEGLKDYIKKTIANN